MIFMLRRPFAKEARRRGAPWVPNSVCKNNYGTTASGFDRQILLDVVDKWLKTHEMLLITHIAAASKNEGKKCFPQIVGGVSVSGLPNG
ncbi:MAG TPA: hypothetical protein IAA42_05760 [Candidatus Olsenella excrementavium]|uniref:Uncharacterized protein n=1 Tax=Candidatus Olsenella excrementavium TaxID=2838709 RepID=A0A9D1ZBS7_9ACTN|nr:hypothetical protein [Candidatus Olsenella excrementavium]